MFFFKIKLKLEIFLEKKSSATKWKSAADENDTFVKVTHTRKNKKAGFSYALVSVFKFNNQTQY